MSIFVQIASYRDSELIPTIDDLLAKATYPELLTVCICRQFNSNDNFDNIDKYRNDSRFKIIDINYKYSKGVCWARNLIQQFYSGETYTLQVDSHSRFIHGWDEKMRQMLYSLQAMGFRKPLLTGYPAAYEPGKETVICTTSPALQMILSHFTSEGIPMFDSKPIPNSDSPVPARFYSAGFCFTLGEFCQEVRHDPYLYFIGEEITITVRAFTHGYDLFHPNVMLVWHYYIRSNSIKQWDDDNDWNHKNQNSFLRVRSLLGISKNILHLREFGLGAIRSLTDYEIYSGIDFFSSRVKEDVINSLFPKTRNIYVKDKFWSDRLARSYEINFEINLETFLSFSFLCISVYDIENVLAYHSNFEKKNVLFNIFTTFVKIKIYFFSFNIPIKWRINIINVDGNLIQEIKQRTYLDIYQKNDINCNL
jgi:hypothetical protein